MKKLFAILLALLLVVCPALAEDSAEADWSVYDALIDSIKAESDPAAREALMHEAEAMLMDTPISGRLFRASSILGWKRNPSFEKGI